MFKMWILCQSHCTTLLASMKILTNVSIFYCGKQENESKSCLDFWNLGVWYVTYQIIKMTGGIVVLIPQSWIYREYSRLSMLDAVLRAIDRSGRTKDRMKKTVSDILVLKTEGATVKGTSRLTTVLGFPS